VSRTIRRKKTTKRFSRFEKDYTHYHPKEWRGITQSTWKNDHHAFPRLPYEGKEFWIRYWKFHSDNGLRIFGFENAFERPQYIDEGQVRALYKKELVKWLKDEDYEIIFLPRPNFWEYY